MSDAYKKAGVDIDAGERLIRKIAPLARTTKRPGADAVLGGFGGIFDLKAAGFRDPLLIAGTDGVGTKLKIAIETGRHESIGIDLVAMCVNDVLAQGAEPLFFLDYFATGKLDETLAAKVLEGVAAGCREAGCALIGGETAEMPGLYQADDYDLAGFCVGAVERENLLPRKVAAGDAIVGLASSGAHANGYSLIRDIIRRTNAALQAPAPFDAARSLGDVLLAPTRIYVKALLGRLADPNVKAFAHITGGGLTENVPRILGKGLAPAYDERLLELPPLFQWLKEAGGLSDAEMRRTFNCGVGGALVCARNAADKIVSELNDSGEKARVIGEIVQN
jgi:phosphoribosylformylglycinamidine cyclo-ligase